MPALPVDKNSVNHLVGIDSPSDTQDRQQYGRVSRTRRPHRAPDYTKRKCPAQKRRTLLWVMLTAKTPDRAWAAYEELLSYRVAIPRHSLHQLARLLASIKPRTRTVHLQLLSVLKTLEMNHGQLRLWEWNTLIDSAGKQWHKTRLEDYENSLDIFHKRGVLPVGNAASADDAANARADPCVTQQNPDIWTYNILLSIASRSNLPLTVRHASSLLLASGLTPNRYTHLCLLRYFAVRQDLRSVRSTLRKMKQQGLEVGLDGINACLWAYGRNGRFDVALRVYRVLRSNVKPTPNLGEHNIDDDARYIRDAVGLDILDGFEPDGITYTTMIQTLAYHGDLRNALSVFVDMLSTPNREAGACTDATVNPVCYKPSMTAFRGLFLGFARYGRDPEHRSVEVEPILAFFSSSQATWDQDSLETVFAAFLQLPSLPKPTDRLIYWILAAFDKTSGNDAAKLREVWTKLEAKYGDGWGGRLEEIRKSIFALGDQKA
jgi:pentatricopeptide repeat protein